MSVRPEDIRVAEVFGALTELQREEVALGANVATRDKGEYVFRSGETADFLFIVRRGRVGLYADAHDGLMHPVSIVTNGELLGVSAFFPVSTWEMTARCLMETELLVIPRRWMLSHMMSDADLELRILQSLLNVERNRISDLVAVIVGAEASQFEQGLGAGDMQARPQEQAVINWPGPGPR